MIHLDRSANLPMRQQVYARFRDLITGGQVAPGAQLPSSRVLAEELAVSRNTVVAAFEQLIAEGYVEARIGAGSFVPARIPDSSIISQRAAHVVRSTSSIRPLSVVGKALEQRTKDWSKLLPARPRAFALGLPDVEAFPHTIWRQIASRSWRRSSASMSAYGVPGGLPALRHAVAHYVATARGVRCDPSQVLIVAGSQQGIDLCSRVLLDRGDRVWHEEPGYHAARTSFAGVGAAIVPVPVDEAGIDVDAGLQVEPNPRLIYVTPSHQFPLGRTMSMERRAQLLRAASKANAWVFEDDYDSEFRYAGRALPALQGMDDDGRVIYSGTFSKGLLPGLRLGYLVVPHGLVNAFQAAHTAAGLRGSLSDQAVVADFMTEGYFARHMRRMRTLYCRRRNLIVASLLREMPDLVDVQVPEAGTHVVVSLPRWMSDVVAARTAASAGIATTPLSHSYTSGSGHPALLLGYASVREPLIQRGIRQLAASLRTLLMPTDIDRSIQDRVESRDNNGRR